MKIKDVSNHHLVLVALAFAPLSTSSWWCFCHPAGNTSIVQNPLDDVAFPEYHQSGYQKDAPLPLNERCRNVFYLQTVVSTTIKMICEGYEYRNCNHNSTGSQPSKHVWINHPRIPCCRTTTLNPQPPDVSLRVCRRREALRLRLRSRSRGGDLFWELMGNFEGPNPQCQPWGHGTIGLMMGLL